LHIGVDSNTRECNNQGTLEGGDIAMDEKRLDISDRELARLASEGTVDEYLDAMLNHPIHGRLIEAFALEEDAPEFDETTKRIKERFAGREDASLATTAGALA